MNVTELAEQIASKHGVEKKQARQLVVEAVFKAVARLRTKGDEVSIPGFGKFKVASREARQGRNPATGETIQIAASKKLAFTPAKQIKDALNPPPPPPPSPPPPQRRRRAKPRSSADPCRRAISPAAKAWCSLQLPVVYLRLYLPQWLWYWGRRESPPLTYLVAVLCLLCAFAIPIRSASAITIAAPEFGSAGTAMTAQSLATEMIWPVALSMDEFSISLHPGGTHAADRSASHLFDSVTDGAWLVDPIAWRQIPPRTRVPDRRAWP